jgi:hypothetical protein
MAARYSATGSGLLANIAAILFSLVAQSRQHRLGKQAQTIHVQMNLIHLHSRALDAETLSNELKP